MTAEDSYAITLCACNRTNRVLLVIFCMMCVAVSRVQYVLYTTVVRHFDFDAWSSHCCSVFFWCSHYSSSTVTSTTHCISNSLSMTARDFQLGMDNAAAEPFVDVALLLTACSFTLLVGIIIGYYVETFFKRQKILGAITNAPNTVSYNNISDGEHKDYEAVAGGPCSAAKLRPINLSTNSPRSKSIHTEIPESMLLNTKPRKVPKHIAVIMDGNRRFGKQKHGNSLQVPHGLVAVHLAACPTWWAAHTTYTSYRIALDLVCRATGRGVRPWWTSSSGARRTACSC